MADKEWLSGIAILLTLIGFLPYIVSIRRGRTKPHVFSWIIWGSTTFVVFLAQLADRGGAGAWPIGVSGLITLYIAWLAWLHKSDLQITRSDRWFFAAAMSALPLWYLTDDPLYAVLILTTVDLTGFVPTLRKAYAFPRQEHLTFFAIMAARNAVAVTALEHYSLTTVLFPAATGLACVALILTVRVRRRAPGDGPNAR